MTQNALICSQLEIDQGRVTNPIINTLEIEIL